MGAPLELLKADVKLKEENQILFTAIIRRLQLIIFLHSFFVIVTLAIIFYFFTRRPMEVERAIQALRIERDSTQHQREALRQDMEQARRANDSAQVERFRAEAAKAELLQIEKKYK